MGLLSDLNIDPLALLANILGFLALLFVANRLVFQPIGKVLTEREGDITTTYDKLEADRAEMERLRTDYQERLAHIEGEAREKIQSAIKEAQATRDQILSEANTRSRDMVARAEEEVTREREQGMIALREQVVDLALSAATRVIGNSLDTDRQRQLINGFITSPDGLGFEGALAETAGKVAATVPAAAVAPPAPARVPEGGDNLAALEALKPSPGAKSVRSTLRGAVRKAATGEGDTATSADAAATPAPGTEPEA